MGKHFLEKENFSSGLLIQRNLKNLVNALMQMVSGIGTIPPKLTEIATVF